MSQQNSFSPSQAGKGFSPDDPRCPLLLGNGIGPKIYQIMYEKWNEIQTKDTAWFERHATGLTAEVTKMMARIQACDINKHDEGVLSSHVSIALQRVVPIISKATGRNWNVVHQFFVQDKSRFRVDVAIVDSDRDTINSLLEVMWSCSDFPESEATAYARCFACDKVNPHDWLPVFALSKNNLQFGVAFDGIGGRWAYSEIFKKSWADESVLLLMKFAFFLVRSAETHSAYTKSIADSHLVDKFGSVIISDPEVIGNRVLLGRRERKIMKFYANHQDAELALEKQADMQSVLEARTNANLHDGCCVDGICVIVDDFIEHEKRSLSFT